MSSGERDERVERLRRLLTAADREWLKKTPDDQDAGDYRGFVARFLVESSSGVGKLLAYVEDVRAGRVKRMDRDVVLSLAAAITLPPLADEERLRLEDHASAGSLFARDVLASRGAVPSPDGGDLPALETVLMESISDGGNQSRFAAFEHWAKWLAQYLLARGVGALPAPREDERHAAQMAGIKAYWDYLDALPSKAEQDRPSQQASALIACVNAALGASRSGGGSGTVPGAGAIPALRELVAALGNEPGLDMDAVSDDLGRAMLGAQDALREGAALSAGPPPDAPDPYDALLPALGDWFHVALVQRPEWLKRNRNPTAVAADVVAHLRNEAALRASPPLPQRIP